MKKNRSTAVETMFSAMQMKQCEKNYRSNGIIATFSALYHFYTSRALHRGGKYHTQQCLRLRTLDAALYGLTNKHTMCTGVVHFR